MKPVVAFVIAVGLVGFTACATNPILPFQRLAVEPIAPLANLKPLDPQSAAVGISVKNDQWSRSTDNRILLVRVEKEEDLHGRTLMPSSVQLSGPDHGTVYLLNVQPGRFAAVGYTQTTVRGSGAKEVRVFLFSQELIQQTLTTVVPGRVTFMGEYELGSPRIVLGYSDVDVTQAHYFLILWGKPLQQVLSELALAGTITSFGCLTQGLTRATRTEKAAREFLTTASQDLDSRWSPMITASQNAR